MTISGNPSDIAEAVHAFFAEHEVASLRLPSGWFGRPHDNWHQLTEITTADQDVLVRLDDKQVLTLRAEAVSFDDRVLRVAIRGGAGTGPSTAATRNTQRFLDQATLSSTRPSTPEAAPDRHVSDVATSANACALLAAV